MSLHKTQEVTLTILDKYHRQGKDNSGGRWWLEALTSCHTLLTAQIEVVKVDISLIRQDFQMLREWVKTAETRLGEMEDARQDRSTCN